MHKVIVGIALALAVLLGGGCSKQAKKARHLERAGQYFQAGQYDKAEIEYRNALRLEAMNPEAIQRLAVIYFQQGRYLQAIPFVLKAKELNTNDVQIRLLAARLLVGAGKAKEAREDALYVLANSPGEEEAYMVLVNSARTTNDLAEVQQQVQRLARTATNQSGFHIAQAMLALARRDLKTAEAALTQAEVLNPKSANAFLTKAALYWATNDLARADQAFKTATDLAGPRSPHSLKYAEFKLETGAKEEAKKLLEGATAKAPDYVPAQVQLFKILMGEGQVDECEVWVKKVLARDPLNLEAMLMSAQIQMARRKPAEAIRELDRANSVYAKLPIIQYRLALAYLLNNETSKALAALEQATKLDPDYAEAILLLAELNTRKGNADAAIASLTQLVRKQPRLLLGHLALANAYRVRGRLPDALAVYRKLQETLPKDPQLPYLIGVVLREQRKPAEALKAFEQALSLAPNNLQVVQQVVELQIEAKQYDAARKSLQAILDRDPKSSAARVLQATTFLAEGNNNEAERILKETIDADPNARGAYMLLSQIYMAGGKPAEALERLNTLVQRTTNDVPALMLLGMLNERMNQAKEAKEAYERILQVNPRFAPALNNLAYLYSEHFGKLDEAFDLARRARDITPTDPYSGDTLGWIVYQRGDYPWALNLLQESAQKLPNEPEILYHLGMAHYMMGEEDPARAALSRAASSPRDFRGKKEAADTLALLGLDPARVEPQALQSLEQRLAQRPGDPVVLSRLAAVYVQTGATNKAVKLYEDAVRANPKNASLKIQLARVYAERLGDIPKALEQARAARSLEPEDPHIGHLVGRLAYQAGDHKWALSLLQDSARRMPEQPDVQYDLALASFAMGRRDDAATALQQVAQGEPNPRQTDAKVMLQMLAWSTNLALAAQSVNRIQEVLKEDASNGPALLALAAAAQSRGDTNLTRQAFERVLALYPNAAHAMRGLALVLARSGTDDAKAYELAAKARETLTDDPELARTLGVLAYRRGDLRRVSTLLRESAPRLPNDPELFYYLGMAQYRLKETRESKQTLQRALGLDLRPDLAQEAKRVIAELK